MHEWITKDFGWKLASVGLAVAIWVTVYKYEAPTEHGTTVDNTYGDLPILVFSATADPRMHQIAPDTVSVKVSGPEKLMNQLQGSQIRPFVDMTGAESAKSFRLPVNVALPKGVILVEVDPAVVDVLASRH